MLNAIKISGQREIMKVQDVEKIYQENRQLRATLELEQNARLRLEKTLEQTKERYAKLDKETRLHKVIFDLAEEAYANRCINPQDGGYGGAIARLLALVKE